MQRFDTIRVEPDGAVGIIIDAVDSDTSLTAIPTRDLFNKVFGLAGYAASPSSGGLLTRQIISTVGGLQGGRAFKIPGVRRLLKTFGPTAHFTKRTAPVVLTLQQLKTNLSSLNDAIHSISLDNSPIGGGAPCEIDFVWMIVRETVAGPR
jgi:hypothetical protein